jgi:hypothetical protein
MKRMTMFGLLLLALLSTAPGTWADPMDELIDSLTNEYESLIPAPNSSVGTDYPTRQAALGSLYTARSVGLVYEQNQEMLSQQRELTDKYDEIIEQNREIIRLLGVIAERLEPVEEVPGVPGADYSEQ